MSDETSYDAALRAWTLEHHIPEAAVERWIALGQTGAMALLDTARELRLRTGQLLNALEMIAEIGLREHQGAAAILARPELRAALRGAGSRPERASAFIDRLRELRFPRLARTRARLEAAVAALRLPQGLAIVLPKDLHSDELMIRLTARNSTELENLLAALADRKEEIKRLLGVLGGSDEI